VELQRLGVGDWFRKQKQKKKAKKAMPQPEKQKLSTVDEKEQSTLGFIADEKELMASDLSIEKAEASTSKSIIEESRELTSEHLTQQAKESTTALADEKNEALESEIPNKETKEPTPEAIVSDEPKELVQDSHSDEVAGLASELEVENNEGTVPEQFSSEKSKKPIPSPWKLAFRGLSKKRKQKGKTNKKEKTEKKPKKPRDGSSEPEFLKPLIFPITLASMLLGLSMMPLFPQPLPAILAFLIAFLAYQYPRIGMPIGGLTIGIGLIYNLSEMNFISMLGAPEIRGATVFILLFLFTALPVVFYSRRALISINLGIIAALLLFFSQTYFLAIPLIFTAIVLFKRLSFLTVIYYLLISVPFQIMQYLNFVLPIDRWDWWIEPGTSPPIYVPLTEIFSNIQESMLQFRLYDTSNVVYSISDQITLDPPVMERTVLEMLSHYLDSLPGIVLFLFIVIGLVSLFLLFTRMFFAKSSISHGERLIPTLSATVGVALFFILASSLQDPLAFRVDITTAQMTIATFATLLFTFPAIMVDYTPKKLATIDMILDKAKELKTKVQIFEDALNEVNNNLPLSTGSFEVKKMMVEDRLDDVFRKTSMRLDESSEIDKIFHEIDRLNHEIENLMLELSIAVGEYQIFVNCEYSKWLGMFEDIGVETENTVKIDFRKAELLETRIVQIKDVLSQGRSFTNEIIKVAEQVYAVLRSFYDSDLPKESQSVAFARKKLAEKAPPWIALDALFTALNNWSKQYKVQISQSVTHLQDALASIANLGNQNEKMESIIGGDFTRILENVEKAKSMKSEIEENALGVVNIMTIKDFFKPSLNIARDILSIFYEKLISKQKEVEDLAPSEEFFWEKNESLTKRMAHAMELTSKSSQLQLGHVLEKLPGFFLYIPECIETISLYNETEELLLNYPMAEKAVETLLREKGHISAGDLPFKPKYAEEYLKMFYSQRYRDFSFDKTNMLLTKRA
jgi:hypothetical protein